MQTREILSIVALAALGVCLLCGLVKMAMKVPKAKQSCDHACSLSLFAAVVLVGVSQLVQEEGYSVQANKQHSKSLELVGKGFSLYSTDVLGPDQIGNNIERIKDMAKKHKLSRLIIGFLHLGKGETNTPILGPDGKTPISPDQILPEGAAKGIPISNSQIGFIPCDSNNKTTCWAPKDKNPKSFLNGNNGTASTPTCQDSKTKCKDLKSEKACKSCGGNWVVTKTGDILMNNTILIQDGKPYNETSFNKWKNHLKELHDLGIELSWTIGGAMNSDFLNFLVTGVDKNGFTTSSVIYKNFKALYDLLPFVNWLDLDLENHLSDPSHLAKLWKSLHPGNKISISPYTPPPPQFGGSQFADIVDPEKHKGLVDLVNLQCYCGGMQPPTFICNATIQYWNAKNIPISIGFCQTKDCGDNCPQMGAVIISYLKTFKQTIKNLKGFFIWNLDALLNDMKPTDADQLLSGLMEKWESDVPKCY